MDVRLRASKTPGTVCVGAVTALAFTENGRILLVGCGPQLSAYSVATGALLDSVVLLDHGVIHRVVVSEHSVLAFGQKRLCSIDIVSLGSVFRFKPDSLTEMPPRTDWIWDVADASMLYPEAGGKTFAIITAKNIVEFVRVLPGNPWPSAPTIACQRCAIHSVVFCASIVVKSSGVWVASGAVTNDILVWNALTPSGAVVATLKGHSGAVFATKWSSNGAYLVSVGDDRTVKLWAGPDPSLTVSTIQSPIWSSFGHTARVWKCDFVGTDEELIMTGSQDGATRLWRRVSGVCCAVLTGHDGKHVWSLASTPNNQVMATGGGDGVALLWSVPRVCHRFTCEDVCQSFLCPPALSVVDTPPSGTVSLRSGTVSGSGALSKAPAGIKEEIAGIVALSAEPGQFVIATSQGMLYRLDSLSNSWHFLGRDRAESAVAPSTATGCCFKLSPSKSRYAVGHANGTVATGTLAPFGVGAIPTGSWKVSTSRVLDIFWTDESLLWVCTGSGAVKVLAFDAESVASSVATYKLPGSAQCTSVCVSAERGLVFLGTARGGVVVFRLEFCDAPQLLCVARHVHKKERVRAMQLEGNVLHVAGHTGQVMQLEVCVAACTCGGVGARAEHTTTSFDYDFGESGGWYTPRYRPQVQLLPPFSSELTCHCQVVSVVRVGTLRFKTIVGVQDFSLTQHSATVIGWHAKHLLISDVSPWGHRELLKLDCGNWHRVHDVLVTNDNVTIAHVFRNTVKTYTEVLPRKDAFVRGVGAAFHGQTANDVAWVTVKDYSIEPVAVTAADDLLINVYSQPIGRKPPQQLHGHLCTVRALMSCPHPHRNNEAVMVSVGGRDSLLCWRFVLNTDPDVPPKVTWLCSAVRETVSVDQRALAVTVFPLADYRATAADFLIVTGNSEGVVSVFVLLERFDELKLLSEFTGSTKPVLCLEHVCIGEGSGVFVVVGRTDGSISLLDVTACACAAVEFSKPGSLGEFRSAVAVSRPKMEPESELDGAACGENGSSEPPRKMRRNEAAIAQLTPISETVVDDEVDATSCCDTSLIALRYCYSAHEMGSNALSVIPASSGSVFIVSGGDDQAVTAAIVNVSLSDATVTGCHVFKYPQMAVAAFTGIHCDLPVVVACGIDQRLTVFRINVALYSELGKTDGFTEQVIAPKTAGGLIQYQSSQFVEASNVSGLAVTRFPGGWRAAVVGLGLQALDITV